MTVTIVSLASNSQFGTYSRPGPICLIGHLSICHTYSQIDNSFNIFFSFFRESQFKKFNSGFYFECNCQYQCSCILPYLMCTVSHSTMHPTSHGLMALWAITYFSPNVLDLFYVRNGAIISASIFIEIRDSLLKA